jgi:hypothetical protein
VARALALALLVLTLAGTADAAVRIVEPFPLDRYAGARSSSPCPVQGRP